MSSAPTQGRTLWRMLLALQMQRRSNQSCSFPHFVAERGLSSSSSSSCPATEGGHPLPRSGGSRTSTWARVGGGGSSGGDGSSGGGTAAAAAGSATPAATANNRRASFSSSAAAAAAAAASATPTTPTTTPTTTAATPPPPPGRGRFYDTVRIAPVHDPAAMQPPPPPPPRSSRRHRAPSSPWWQLLLRGYPVKTPGQRPLLLPTRALALAVAGEWEWLPQGRPLPVAMPLTALCATAADEPKPRAAIEKNLLNFVHTDAAAVRYDPGTALERKQTEAFDALLAWAADPSGPVRCPDGPLAPSSAVSGAPQTAGTERAFARYLSSLDAWTLAAVDQATAASKSLVVACALAEGRLPADEAVRCARLEEDHQTDEWGVVEAGHDLDACDTATRVRSAALLVRLLRME